MTVNRRCFALAIGAALLPDPARPATLRPFGTLRGPTVAVADLWDGAGALASVVLGPAPAPGERIVVEAAQLAAIARQFGVDWRPATATERSILERPGVLLPRARVEAALRGWFASAGMDHAVDESAIELTGFAAPLVAPDADAEVAVEQCAWQESGGRFDATLAVTGRGMAALRLAVAGRLVAVTTAVLAARRLSPGSVLTQADLMTGQVPRERARGPVATDMAQAAGLVIRRALTQGEPVLLADLSPPPVVTKGMSVGITIAANGVELTATGEALESGPLGAQIDVRNPVTRAVMRAQVTGPAQVRVRPGSLPLLPPPPASGSATP